MEPLRFGILGAARIAENAIVRAAEITRTPLVAVAARDRGRAQEFAARHGIKRVLDSYEAVLADPDVEAVYNPLPNGLHGPWNLAAVAAGKHVLSEKPFASNADEAREVHDAGVKAGVAVAEAFHYLYHPLMRRLHEVIASGELGELERLESTMAIPAPMPTDPRWSFDLAGGALMDVGCYALHAHRTLAPWAGGEPSVVRARGEEREGCPQVDEWVDAELAFPSGVAGLARCSMANDGLEMSLRVHGTRASAYVPNFVLPHLDDRLIVSTPDGERVEHLGTRSSYTYQLEAFAAFVREGTPMPTDSADAVATMRLIDDTYAAMGLPPRPSSSLGG